MAENAVDSVGSPLWWMARLSRRQQSKLSGNQRFGEEKIGLTELKKWSDGNPPLPEGAPKWKQAYQNFHKTTRTNYALLVNESARERMTPLGFRTGASGDENGDATAEQVWLSNHMEVESVQLLSDMLGLREGYTMVTPAEGRRKFPKITVEDPLCVSVATDPTDRWDIRAAMKQYRDEDMGEDITWVWITDEATGRARGYRAVRGSRTDLQPFSRVNASNSRTWIWDDKVVELPVMPFVRFPNLHDKAEFEPHIDLLGRLNHTTLQRMLIAEIQAFRQRAVKGLPTHWPMDHSVPELRGKEIDYEGVFEPGPGALWQVPDGVEFWESAMADIRPLLDAEDRDLRKLSALTHMPVAYFNPDTANSSAEGASFQREGLIYRIEDRQDIAQVGLNRTMANAFIMMGDDARGDITKMETIWAPIERLSLTERYQSATQGKAAGLADLTVRREILGWTPAQIRRAAADDSDQLLRDQRRAAAEAALAARFQQRQPQQNPQTGGNTNGDQQPLPRSA